MNFEMNFYIDWFEQIIKNIMRDKRLKIVREFDEYFQKNKKNLNNFFDVVFKCSKFVSSFIVWIRTKYVMRNK